MPLLLLGSALCRFQVFSLVLTSVTAASTADDFATRCEAEESRREHSEAGAVLLQLKGAGNAAVAARSAAPAEQLEQYAKLKDDGHDSAAALANDVQTLDEVLKIQDSLPTQVADAGTLAQPKNDLNPEMSLLEQSATTRTESSSPVVADADAANMGDAGPAADADGNISETASTNSTSEGGLLEATNAAAANKRDEVEAASAGDEIEAAPAAAADEAASAGDETEAAHAAAANAEQGDIQSDLEADDDDADSEEQEEDDEAARNKKALQLSMLSLRDALLINEATLNEAGYLGVAARRSNKQMELFVQRLCTQMGFTITDIGGLKGMVPYYSGRKSTQSFKILLAELRSTADGSPDSWLTKPRHKRIHKGGKLAQEADVATRHRPLHPHRRAKDAALVEEDADTADATKASQVSLLGLASTRVARAAHKVPDVAMALFGSRNVFFVITIALAACLFCLDERNRTRNTNYEDVLNMSPEPPPQKEDPAVAASLKLLRGGAGALK